MGRSISPYVRPSSLALLACLVARPALADPAEGVALQLELIRNGEPTGLIVSVRETANGEITAKADEIRAMGLVVPAKAEAVALSALPGVRFAYDRENQQLLIEAEADALAATVISLSPPPERIEPSRDWGGLINYNLSLEHRGRGDPIASGTFEARAFGVFGMAATGFVAVGGGGEDPHVVRLDSAWTFADPNRAATLRAGDLIGSGLTWTRPMRLGGVQYGRDFVTRPDIIIQPTPELSISAAAPSMLDVMLGDSVLMSQRVSAGPVQVVDLPSQGQGMARLVLRDAQGRRQEVAAAYFASPELLRKGLSDFSIEAGFARRGFGLRSADYDDRLVAAASGRWGVRDDRTVQFHAEAGAGLAMVGAGVVQSFGGLGVASGALAGSAGPAGRGGLANLTFDGRLGTVSVAGQAQRTFGPYADLVSVTADAPPAFRGAVDPPRSLVQFSLSTPMNLAVFKGLENFPTFAVTYANLKPQRGTGRELMSASMHYMLPRGVSLDANVYASTAGRRERGLAISISAPLGGGRSASAGFERTSDRTRSFAEARSAYAQNPGAVDWRVRASQAGTTALAAEATWRAPAARLQAEVVHADKTTVTRFSSDGALVFMGRPFFASEPIQGAFAAVDTGAPGVGVKFQNRPAGRSGRDGRVLVTGLDAYDANLISIDPGDLPLDRIAPQTRMSASPPYGAGARLNFGVRPAPAQTRLSLRLADGEAPPVGVMASVDGGAFDQVIGYDGVLFLAEARPQTLIRVDLGDGASCAASVHLTRKPGTINAATAVCR